MFTEWSYDMTPILLSRGFLALFTVLLPSPPNSHQAAALSWYPPPPLVSLRCPLLLLSFTICALGVQSTLLLPAPLTLPYHQPAAVFAKHRSDRCLYSHSAIAAALATNPPRHKHRSNVKESQTTITFQLFIFLHFSCARARRALPGINRTERRGVKDTSCRGMHTHI